MPAVGADIVDLGRKTLHDGGEAGQMIVDRAAGERFLDRAEQLLGCPIGETNAAIAICHQRRVVHHVEQRRDGALRHIADDEVAGWPAGLGEGQDQPLPAAHQHVGRRLVLGEDRLGPALHGSVGRREEQADMVREELHRLAGHVATVVAGDAGTVVAVDQALEIARLLAAVWRLRGLEQHRPVAVAAAGEPRRRGWRRQLPRARAQRLPGGQQPLQHRRPQDLRLGPPDDSRRAGTGIDEEAIQWR